MDDIRFALDHDAAGVAAIYRPIVEATPISFETEAPDAAAIGRRMRETQATHPWLVCEWEGDIAGYAYASAHRVRAAYQWSADTSVYVRQDHRGRGVGRGLYASLLALLRLQGFVNAYAGITLPNAGSVGLHEAVGFTPVGVYQRVGYKLGAWHDVGWWQLALQPHRLTPPPPLPLPAVLDRPDLAALVATGLPHIRPISRPG
jgi:L-amino acid N-acyltransferase YncA